MRKNKKQKRQRRIKGSPRYIEVPSKTAKLSNQTKSQILKFAIVGGLATATHAGLFALVLEAQLAGALQANFIAFAVAFLISFLGQYHWTFRNISKTHWTRKMLKFLIVALIGLGMNTAGVLVIVDWLLLPYPYAVLFMVTVVPVTTFIVNKNWAFA
ncbi:GtrA family protein [Methylomonas koyamae]|uniref:GtrA family protein n=1 Tax=Methylomonas koyamae TaxID=702114 RepID=UPI0006D1BBD6|nr:GtrA family protein [Methylomonas koyamae]BBL60455.1 hypothetical protein MKFW12EY_40680 [Methylomonas koyamae]